MVATGDYEWDPFALPFSESSGQIPEWDPLADPAPKLSKDQSDERICWDPFADPAFLLSENENDEWIYWDPFADPAVTLLSNQDDACVQKLYDLQQAMATVEVSVSSLTGNLCNVCVDYSGSIADLKVQIESQTGIPFFEQELVADSIVLTDDIMLKTIPLETLKSLTMVRSNDPVLASVSADGLKLCLAPDYCRDDASYVRAAVRQNGLALEYATEVLRADRNIVILAVRQHGLALKHASDALKADREVVLRAVKRHGHALQYADRIFRDDVDIVRAAVARTGSALRFASERLRSDLDTAVIAVKQDPQAVFITNRVLWNYPEFVDAIQADQATWRIFYSVRAYRNLDGPR
mmetsp:Transcript_97571/g.172754  ORF Transcript_97571/g.172754 Transcript_97571/m.172754 type:complete len:352 (-) Transcript_97571:15-1070(-)